MIAVAFISSVVGFFFKLAYDGIKRPKNNPSNSKERRINVAQELAHFKEMNEKEHKNLHARLITLDSKHDKTFDKVTRICVDLGELKGKIG